MNNKKLLTAISITIIVTAVFTFFATTNYIYYNGLSKTQTVLSLLRDNFYKEFDGDKFDEAAVRAGVKSLNDPYTEYMDPSEWESFLTEINDNYCGIGVGVTKDDIDSYVYITSVFENSPAMEAGLETGDLILSVNGEQTNGKDLNYIVSKIKGEEGSFAEISVLKASTNEKISLSVERKFIDIDTVFSKIIDNNIGYIQLTSFNKNSSVKFIEHLNELKNSGASSFIIDLRDNGGGITTELEAIVSEFLPNDTIIYSTKNNAGKTRVIKSNKNGNTDMPVVVLINEHTASASEILAAAIKENNRGVLVGQKTYGKGLVQTVYNFRDGSALKLTIEQYFTSGGNNINKLGVEPDHYVELLSADDEQLQYAIDILNK